MTALPDASDVDRRPEDEAIRAAGPAHRHPDRRTAWVIVLLARLGSENVHPPVPLLDARLEEAASTEFPLLRGRLHGDRWVRSTPPVVRVEAHAPDPLAVAPLGPFDLTSEPPLRVMTDRDGGWLLLCAHHFAFDGLGMVSLLRHLLTGSASRAPDYTKRTSPRRNLTEPLRRLLAPAHRVAPSPDPPARESFASAQVEIAGPNVTARLASACVEAARTHNIAQRRPLRRAGLSVAVGGVGGESATYRRIDVRPGDDIEGRVRAALASPAVPPEVNGLPRGSFLLRPVLARFSDTVLVSNLGRLDLPLRSLEFYPVARGRSAVAVGAAGLGGRATTITVRARDLDRRDATSFLDNVITNMEEELTVSEAPIEPPATPARNPRR